MYSLHAHIVGGSDFGFVRSFRSFYQNLLSLPSTPFSSFILVGSCGVGGIHELAQTFLIETWNSFCHSPLSAISLSLVLQFTCIQLPISGYSDSGKKGLHPNGEGEGEEEGKGERRRLFSCVKTVTSLNERLAYLS